MAEARWRYEARGKTYPHREELTSWAWFWNPSKKCWEVEAGQGIQPDDINVAWVRDLPGVTVTAINESTGESRTLGPTGL